jgi:hypothetical protein
MPPPQPGPIKFKEIPVPQVNLLGTLASGSPPSGGTSQISIVETTSSGVVNPAQPVTVTSPATTFPFVAGAGSTLIATQIDVDSSGNQSPPNINPPYLVPTPGTVGPPQPGNIVFSVVPPATPATPATAGKLKVGS